MRVAVILLVMLVTACEARVPQGDAVVRVNGEAITQLQWDAAVEDLERSTGATLDAQARHKVLASLVQSRLMATAAAKLLDADETAAMNAEVALHRERLLVKEYLRRTANPAPVTETRVQAYYAEHPEQFGATETRHFELLTTEDAPASAQRAPLLDAMGALREQESWEPPPVDNVRWIHRLEDTGNLVLDARIRAIAEQLAPNETSDVVFIDAQPYLVRVTHIEQQEPQPLAQVRDSIQRRLQIEQLQHAVDRAAEELLANAEVEYLVPVKQ